MEDNVFKTNYVNHFFFQMNNLYTFEGKNVMFIFLDSNINNAFLIKQMGAKHVYFVNPSYTFENLKNDDISLIGLDKNFLKLIPDKTIDLIIGIEILEHINDLKTFFEEIKRVLKENGNVELHGRPMWTSYNGHHLWIKDKFVFYDDTNPFEPWEHLVYNSQNEMYDALKTKKYSESDSKQISEWIYNPNKISRHTPSEIIEQATEQSMDNLKRNNYTLFVVYEGEDKEYQYFIKKLLKKLPENRFFEIVKTKYPEEDLYITNLILKINRFTT